MKKDLLQMLANFSKYMVGDFHSSNGLNAKNEQQGYFYNEAGGTTINNDETSDFNLMKTNYLKLRNVEIGYTIPSKVLKKVRIQSARVYINSQNVATWDTMWLKDRDPESAGSGTLPYPLQRIFNAGLRFDI